MMDTSKMSHLEIQLWAQIADSDLPRPESEHKFHDTRQWRLDYAWPKYKVGVEIQGGLYTGGAHVRAKGYESDCHKMIEAQLDGWLILYITAQMLNDDVALGYIERALKQRGYE